MHTQSKCSIVFIPLFRFCFDCDRTNFVLKSKLSLNFWADLYKLDTTNTTQITYTNKPFKIKRQPNIVIVFHNYEHNGVKKVEFSFYVNV